MQKLDHNLDKQLSNKGEILPSEIFNGELRRKNITIHTVIHNYNCCVLPFGYFYNKFLQFCNEIFDVVGEDPHCLPSEFSRDNNGLPSKSIVCISSASSQKNVSEQDE